MEIFHTPDLFNETPDRLFNLLAGTETLIHAAWYAEPGRYLTSPINLDCLTGTLNLASAFAAAGGRRFVGVGSCAEYATTDDIITVDTPLAPTSLYASCKAATFLVLRSLLGGHDVSFAWCRLFYLYGEGEDGRRLVPYIRTQMESGQEAILTSGNQIRDFMDVAEAGRMVSRVALGKRQGAINICSGIGLSVRELAERIADEYGRRDLLRFGIRPESAFDPPKVVGSRDDLE